MTIPIKIMHIIHDMYMDYITKSPYNVSFSDIQVTTIRDSKEKYTTYIIYYPVTEVDLDTNEETIEHYHLGTISYDKDTKRYKYNLFPIK